MSAIGWYLLGLATWPTLGVICLVVFNWLIKDEIAVCHMPGVMKGPGGES